MSKEKKVNQQANDGLANGSPIDWTTTDLITCVELNYKKPDAAAQADAEPDGVVLKDVYHFLYASQLYGTLFGVYGKFSFSENDLKVTGVDLQLLNYSGVMNIGFCGVMPDDIPDDIAGKPPKEHIYFGVKGDSPLRSIYVEIRDHVSGASDSIQMVKGVHQRIKFCRLLYPLNGFNMDPGYGTDLTLPVPIPNSQFFDSEFHYRSGTDFYNSAVRPGMQGYKPITLVSVRCIQSNVNLIYY